MENLKKELFNIISKEGLENIIEFSSGRVPVSAIVQVWTNNRYNEDSSEKLVDNAIEQLSKWINKISNLREKRGNSVISRELYDFAMILKEAVVLANVCEELEEEEQEDTNNSSTCTCGNCKYEYACEQELYLVHIAYASWKNSTIRETILAKDFKYNIVSKTMCAILTLKELDMLKQITLSEHLTFTKI